MTPAMFNFKENSVSIINDNGNILFAGVEVARALGYKNPHIKLFEIDESEPGQTKRPEPGKAVTEFYSVLPGWQFAYRYQTLAERRNLLPCKSGLSGDPSEKV